MCSPFGILALASSESALRVPEAPRILLLAGEASGDRHGAQLAAALRERWPEARLCGMGGPLMQAEGVELIAGLDELAVMGFAEVVRHLPFFWRLFRRVKRRLDAGDIDLVIPIDYPGFNLRVTRAAHERGIPTLFYIAPQVWAWKPARARILAENADRLAVILRFETDIFREAGANVTFVGHPLLDDIAPKDGDRDALVRAGLDPDKAVLALLPGSRPQELYRHLDLFVEVARRVQRTLGESVQIALARAPGVDRTLLAATGLVVVDDAQALLRAARAALVKSGTGTLEAALCGTPFVVAYRTHPLTAFLAKRLLRIESVALANLVAGEQVVPEVLQRDATPEALVRLLLPLFDLDSPERMRQVEGLGRIQHTLGTPGAARRVAALAAELIPSS